MDIFRKIRESFSSIETRINKIEGIEIIFNSGIRHVKFSKNIPPKSLNQLLQLLRENKISFSFFDDKYPEISDPGAYFSYSQERSDEKENWSMTFGNHGWSGGIYQIKESTIITQLRSLIKSKLIEDIQIEKVAFFSQYRNKNLAENFEMDSRILELHKNKK